MKDEIRVNHNGKYGINKNGKHYPIDKSEMHVLENKLTQKQIAEKKRARAVRKARKLNR